MIFKPILPEILVGAVLFIIYAALSFGIVKRKTKLIYKLSAMLRIFVIMALCFVINMRPMRKEYNMDVEMKNLDVLFVVDTTISMWAEDVNGKPRMDAVQKDCQHIVDVLDGSNFALMRFDNKSQILAPFTQDSSNVLDAFSTISTPSRHYAKGSNLNVVEKDLEDLLVSSNKKEGRMTVVFFISDGEVTDDSELMSYDKYEKYVDGGAVLGYGTKKGGLMKEGYGYIKDPSTYQDAVSIIDEDNLQKIAKDMQIDYIHMQRTGDIDYVLNTIKAASKSIIDEGKGVNYEDTYFWYVIPLILLLLAEVVIYIRRGRL
ncbi:MAG: VWA domain-containing protein [Eubacterium sp.]|nr:VWA domain-containing protein [Eubacterium sp.]